MGGGGGGNSGPTVQQQQLETRQAQQVAQLNLEENSQRKSILNAMLGTRVFRGSALSRAVAGNEAGVAAGSPVGPSSKAQRSAPFSAGVTSLVNPRQTSATTGSGNTAAGGTGASGGVDAGTYGGYRGGGSKGFLP